jgi:hypothetical protein
MNTQTNSSEQGGTWFALGAVAALIGVFGLIGGGLLVGVHEGKETAPASTRAERMRSTRQRTLSFPTCSM